MKSELFWLRTIACLTTLMQLFEGANAAGADEIELGGECYSDSVCVTYCCSNDNDYHTAGECVLLEDDARCESRKKTYNIILLIIILVMIAATVIFGWMKKREINENEARLRRLKIEAQNEENKRLQRNEEPD